VYTLFGATLYKPTYLQNAIFVALDLSSGSVFIVVKFIHSSVNLVKKKRQQMHYDVTLRRFRATIIAVEKL